MTRVYLFNGPPGSGKDTLAEGVQRLLSSMTNAKVRIESFKHALFQEAADLIPNLTVEEFIERHEDRELKETPWDALPIRPHDQWHDEPTHHSTRSWLIHVSERLIKPKYGDSFFGDKLVERIDPEADDIILVSDSGFYSEIEPLINAFGVENVSVIRIGRKGYSFAGDSRGWVDVRGRFVHVLQEEGNPSSAIVKAADVIEYQWVKDNQITRTAGFVGGLLDKKVKTFPFELGEVLRFPAIKDVDIKNVRTPDDVKLEMATEDYFRVASFNDGKFSVYVHKDYSDAPLEALVNAYFNRSNS